MQGKLKSKISIGIMIGLCILLLNIPALAETQTQPVLPGTDVVEVSDITAFLQAIQPNRTIKLLPGDYNLSALSAEEIAAIQQPYVTYSGEGDPHGVMITNVDNLAIVADERQEIYSMSMYDTVLFFENCNHVTVSGLTFGHHKEDLYPCSAGVIALFQCSDMTFDQCEFYGCGVVGITMNMASKIVVSHSVIRDCTKSAAWIYTSNDIEFSQCDIHDIATEGDMAEVFIVGSDSANVVLDHCTIHDNGSDYTSLWPMFTVETPHSLSMQYCVLTNNQYGSTDTNN